MHGSGRLDLRLPVDHPIFSIPPGQRTKVAKEWLDIGENVKRVISEQLEQIESRLVKHVKAIGGDLTEEVQKINSRLEVLSKDVSEIKGGAAVGREDQGLAVIIDDCSRDKEIDKGDFKIPSAVINAFDNWGVDK